MALMMQKSVLLGLAVMDAVLLMTLAVPQG